MEYKILILLGMIFCHIVDDYYLQKAGSLAFLKQKDWWKENAPDSMYKYDYIVALIMHSFSWAFSITLLPLVYSVITGRGGYSLIIFILILNVALHAIIDDLKANHKEINLIQDQCLHLLQIVITWHLCVL